MKKKLLRFFLFLSIAILIFLPVMLPLFQQGFFMTDDGEWMIIRFSAFYQALADGQFPVRFLHRLNFDHGYPVATFLYPGFMYAAVPFHLVKIGLVDTIKIIFGVSLVGTTIFTYLWLSKLFTKKSAAIVGAFASLYLPYHVYDVYTRGSVGEIFALLFVPFILWMLERKNFFFVSIGIALLLLAHNSLALLFLPFLFIYAFLRKTFSLKNIFLSFILGILLSAFFIIPAVFELSFTNFSQTVIADPTKYLADLSLIGVSTLVIFIVAGFLFIFRKKSLSEHTGLVQFFLLLTFFSVAFSSSVSGFFWNVIPSSFIQFPFRLLSYLIISLAFLSAFIVSQSQEKKMQWFIVIAILVITFVSSYQFLTPKEYIDKGEGYYLTNEATTTVQDEYMPMWVKDKPTSRSEKKVKIVKGEGTIENISYNNKETQFTLTAQDDARVRVNTIYWPGWRVFVDNKETTFSYNNPKGVIEFDVPGGTHQVKASFGETASRLVADVVSIVSLGVLLVIVFRVKKLK